MKGTTIAQVAIGVIASVVLAACSSGGDEADADGGSSSSEAGIRTVEIQTLDSLSFDPSEIRVGAGETVRFVISNQGTVEHEFLIGDESDQEEHEAEMNGGGSTASSPMAGMGGTGEMATLVRVAPGEVKELTRTFEKAGTLLYACHVPGHYAGGMIGSITVS